MTLQGIDVSAYQSTTPSLAGLSFVFVRATYGGLPDTRYAMHAANVRAAGLVLGAYHFGRSGAVVPVAQQVDAFLAAAAGADLLALDLESDGSPSMTAAEAQSFIALVHARGHRIGLYHSLSGFPSVGQDFNWVASWGRITPPIAWTFWQNTGSPLDHDVFNGDAAALARLVGDPMDPTMNPGGTYDIKAGVSLYGDPGRQTVLVAKYAGAKSVPFYYTATLPALSCFRLNLQTAANPKYVLAYVGADALTPTADPTPFSQADITSASSKAFISGFNAGRQAVLDAGANVPVRQ